MKRYKEKAKLTLSEALAYEWMFNRTPTLGFSEVMLDEPSAEQVRPGTLVRLINSRSNKATGSIGLVISETLPDPAWCSPELGNLRAGSDEPLMVLWGDTGEVGFSPGSRLSPITKNAIAVHTSSI